MAGYTTPTVWNADEERTKMLLWFLASADVSLYKWDLEGIYSSLHQVKRIAYAKLRKSKTQWEDIINNKFPEMEKLRRKYLITMSDNDKIEFFNKCEEIYMEINAMLQDHGIYFRESDDPRHAALET